MIPTIEQLSRMARELPPDQQYTLAGRILASVEILDADEHDHAWDCEIRERIRRYDAGDSHGIPAEEVFSQIDSRLAR